MREDKSHARCLFCQTTTGKRTREHVWRRALRTQFRPVSSLTFWESSAAKSREFVETRPITQFDITLNDVCSNCNSGWLNNLEDDALPTLISLGRMEGRAPTAEQLKSFAFWAVVRALIRTRTSLAGHAPDGLFQAVYANRFTQEVPPGCVVLVAPTQPVDMEAGLHQSAVIDSCFVGHVAVAFGLLLVSVFLGGPDPTSSQLAARAAEQVRRWFPGTLWEVAPNLSPHPFIPRYLTPIEAKVAGSCLGFFLDAATRDQFGKPITLDVVPESHRGDVPWLGYQKSAI